MFLYLELLDKGQLTTFSILCVYMQLCTYTTRTYMYVFMCVPLPPDPKLYSKSMHICHLDDDVSMRHEVAVDCLHWDVIRHCVLQEPTKCRQLEEYSEGRDQGTMAIVLSQGKVLLGSTWVHPS